MSRRIGLTVSVEDYGGDEDAGVLPANVYEVGVDMPESYYDSHKNALAFDMMVCAAAWWTKDDDDETSPLDWELMQALVESGTSILGQPLYRVSYGTTGDVELMSKVDGEDHYLVWDNIDASFPRVKLRMLHTEK